MMNKRLRGEVVVIGCKGGCGRVSSNNTLARIVGANAIVGYSVSAGQFYNVTQDDYWRTSQAGGGYRPPTAGANQYTGKRTARVKTANALKTLGRTSFVLSAGLSVVDYSNGAENQTGS